MSTTDEPLQNNTAEALRALEARLAAMEKRLAEVEHRQPAPSPELPATAHLPGRMAVVSHTSPTPLEPYTFSEVVTPGASATISRPTARPPLPPSSVPPTEIAPPPPTPGRRAANFAHRVAKPVTAPVRSAAPAANSLESKIGLSVASWVGALVVLGGVLFFLKYAWDMGWLRLSPEMRILLALAAGAAMIGIGEWLHFKKMPPLAAALAGVGLAVLMAALFAGNTLFPIPVIPREIAFIGVMLVGALGIALAFHMRVQTLAVLSLLGMYISPFILSSGEDRTLALFAYLFVVTASGLAVSFFKEGWPAVRSVAFVGGWLWLFIWTALSSFVAANFEIGIAAVALFFALYVAEMAGNLVRASKGNPAEGRPESPVVQRMESIVSLLSFVNTALAMSLMAVIFYRTGTSGLWVAALGSAGAMGILTFVTPSKPFNLSAGLQSMGLVVLAVPLYFDRVAITGAWGLLGLGLAIYAYITGLKKRARIWMFGSCSASSPGKVLTFDHYLDPASSPPNYSRIDGEPFTPWMILAWSTALYGLVLAWPSVPPRIAAPRCRQS